MTDGKWKKILYPLIGLRSLGMKGVVKHCGKTLRKWPAHPHP